MHRGLRPDWCKMNVPTIAPMNPIRNGLAPMPELFTAALPKRLCILLVLLLGVSPLRAEVGVEADSIRLGMVNAQSGPAAGLGRGMYLGASASFNRLNATGGVHGRDIALILRDDGYEPSRTVLETKALLDPPSVFALFGYVGTPTSRAVLPMAMEHRVPYLFAFSGAEALRAPLHPRVFNIRASYFQEAAALVDYMVDDLNIRRVAVLMQDDSFGETVKGGLIGALAGHDLRLSAEARMPRNSLELAAPVELLRKTSPEAVFFVGTYPQLVVAIRQAKAAGLQARFFTVSFVGTDDFIEKAGADGEGVYISQVVPSPDDVTLSLVRRYRADLRGARPGYASLEGYIAAEVLGRALREAGAQTSRDGLVKALERFDEDLGGFRVTFSPRDHQGSDLVFLTRVEGGRAVEVESR